jgi:hypothetical protein
VPMIDLTLWWATSFDTRIWSPPWLPTSCGHRPAAIIDGRPRLCEATDAALAATAKRPVASYAAMHTWQSIRRFDMPLIEMYVPKGTLDDDAKRALHDRVSRQVLEAEGVTYDESPRAQAITWMLIHKCLQAVGQSVAKC